MNVGIIHCQYDVLSDCLSISFTPELKSNDENKKIFGEIFTGFIETTSYRWNEGKPKIKSQTISPFHFKNFDNEYNATIYSTKFAKHFPGIDLFKDVYENIKPKDTLKKELFVTFYATPDQPNEYTIEQCRI